MSILKVIILALVQGMAELLPVSSSAHVVVAEKLMGLDASSPQMTLLLVMLHTGTMLAVIAYFWRSWRDTYFKSAVAFKRFAGLVILATVLTAVIGAVIIKAIERTAFSGVTHAAIELRSAYAAALGELPGEQREDLAIRIAELRKLQDGVDAQARAALSLGELDEETVRHALGRLESALRARTATGFTLK